MIFNTLLDVQFHGEQDSYKNDRLKMIPFQDIKPFVVAMFNIFLKSATKELSK